MPCPALRPCGQQGPGCLRGLPCSWECPPCCQAQDWIVMSPVKFSQTSMPKRVHKEPNNLKTGNSQLVNVPHKPSGWPSSPTPSLHHHRQTVFCAVPLCLLLHQCFHQILYIHIWTLKSNIFLDNEGTCCGLTWTYVDSLLQSVNFDQLPCLCVHSHVCSTPTSGTTNKDEWKALRKLSKFLPGTRDVNVKHWCSFYLFYLSLSCHVIIKTLFKILWWRVIGWL